VPNQKVVNFKFMVDQFNFHHLLISSILCKLHELCPLSSMIYLSLHLGLKLG
jgi:hypothetical protein